MGWWGIGGDDIMGDHPADVIGEALQEMTALAATKGVYNVALGELTAAFTRVVAGAARVHVRCKAPRSRAFSGHADAKKRRQEDPMRR
jgi:hypothetical protein